MVPELRDAGYDGRPDGDEDEGDDHPRCDTARHPEEVGQLRVLFDVEGLGLDVPEDTGMAASLGSEALVGGWRGLAERGRLGRTRVGVGCHGDRGVLVGRMGGEGGRRGSWIDGCCCGHVGYVVFEIRIEAMCWKV